MSRGVERECMEGAGEEVDVSAAAQCGRRSLSLSPLFLQLTSLEEADGVLS